MKKYAALLLTLGLYNCSFANDLEQLRTADLSGYDFDHHIARAYLTFSSQEAEKYDWIDSAHFASKGLTASYGRRVMPEDPAEWDVSEDKLKIFTEARELLLWLTNDNIRMNNAELAAQTQFYYDCWLEEEEESWQDDDIAFCKNQFMVNIEKLKQLRGWYETTSEDKKEEIAVLESKKEVMAAESKKEEIVDNKSAAMSYLVFFNIDKKTISDDGMKIIENMVEEAGKHSNFEIILNGHTDTSGPEKHNMSLSQERANNIRKMLIKKGIDTKYISVYAFGETSPMIPTKDNIFERRNRRVEIILEDK